MPALLKAVMWQQNQDVQRGNQVAVSLDQVDWRFLIPGVSKVRWSPGDLGCLPAGLIGVMVMM